MNCENKNMCGMPMPAERRLGSEQGLSLRAVAPGQLHRLEAFGPDSEKFVLVMDVRKNYCDVIPGSLDGYQAGPDDVILPKSAMGGYVMLGLDHPVRLRPGAVGEGFARLAPAVFRKVVRAFVANAAGKGELGLVRGYPYTSENDERRGYRREMVARVDACAIPEMVVSAVPLWNEEVSALAAGDEKTSDIRRAECRVQGFDGLVLLVNNRETGEVSLDAYDAAGEPSAALDGWTLVDAVGNELAEISGGGIRPLEVSGFDGRCCLVDPQAVAHPLTRVTE